MNINIFQNTQGGKKEKRCQIPIGSFVSFIIKKYHQGYKFRLGNT